MSNFFNFIKFLSFLKKISLDKKLEITLYRENEIEKTYIAVYKNGF